MSSHTRPLVLTGPHGPIASNVRFARTFRDRRRGLRGSRPLADDQALVIEPCRQVHTFGVAFDIDAVFCDNELRVVHVQTLRPRRVSRFVVRARMCIELSGGRAAAGRIGPDAVLHFEDAS